MDNEVFESGRLRIALSDVEQQFRNETDVLKKEYEMQLSHANAEVGSIENFFWSSSTLSTVADTFMQILRTSNKGRRCTDPCMPPRPTQHPSYKQKRNGSIIWNERYSIISHFMGLLELKADHASRYNPCVTNEPLRPANSPSHRNISVD